MLQVDNSSRGFVPSRFICAFYELAISCHLVLSSTKMKTLKCNLLDKIASVLIEKFDKAAQAIQRSIVLFSTQNVPTCEVEEENALSQLVKVAITLCLAVTEGFQLQVAV